MEPLLALEELGSAIQAAAATVAFFHPEYCSAEQLVCDITIWCLDNDVFPDIQTMELFGERVWWLMAIGLKIVKAGLNEYENNITGDIIHVS